MFAKEKNGARCIQDYGRLKKYSFTPDINELYADVEDYLKENDWAEIPDDFWDSELTNQQKIDELERSISARRWREAILGDEESITFIASVESQIEELR